jgi:hypothetical protein
VLYEEKIQVQDLHNTGHYYSSMDQSMEVLHIETKGQVLKTWEHS